MDINSLKLIAPPSVNRNTPVRKPARGNTGMYITFSLYRKPPFCSTSASRRREEGSRVDSSSKALTGRINVIWHLFPMNQVLMSKLTLSFLRSFVISLETTTAEDLVSTALLTHRNEIPPAKS